MDFVAMPKMARLSREVVITEKLDGTNASVYIFPQPFGNVDSMAEWEEAKKMAVAVLGSVPTLVLAGSRTRWVTPGKDDNYGWAAWVKEHAKELDELGPGHHFGEWWGKGIQRNYGLVERRFSLFNAGRWAANNTCVLEGQDRVPECCHVVPTLYRGMMTDEVVNAAIGNLQQYGSVAAPGFMDPEGIVVYHTAASFCFKKTIKGDDGKWKEPPKDRAPRAPRDPNKGGRRVAVLPGCEFKRRSTDS